MRRTIIFIGILVIAVIFRFTGINWDQNAHLHPDERFLTMVATNIKWPKSIAEYFDTSSSPANPHNKGFNFYVYGTYPIYLVKLVSQIFNKDTYDGITVIGRVLSGIADLVTLVFVFLISGNLAAFLYAVMVLPIQQSHFFTVDPYATLFLIISLYVLLKKRVGWLLGITVGLAVSAKISSILILPIVLLALIKGHSLARARGGLMKFVLAFLITLRITYPYLFDGWGLNQLVLDNWKALKAFDGVNTSFPPALQWIGVPVWKPTMDIILHGLGLPLGILALISLFVRPNFILVLWVLLVLGYQSIQFAKAMRYLYPIYPALAVLTASTLAAFQNYLRRVSSHWSIGVLEYLFIGVLLLWPIAFVSIYTRPHTRIAASDWIYANVPKGNTLAWEHWDDPLPLSRGRNNIGIYQTLQLPMYDPDTQDKWQKLTKQVSETDYIILSSNRVYGGVAHTIDRYPQTNDYYLLLFAGALGFEKAAVFTSRPTIFGLEFIDDNAEESFTVYDHPRVTVYINKEHKTKEELYTLIINGQQ